MYRFIFVFLWQPLVLSTVLSPGPALKAIVNSILNLLASVTYPSATGFEMDGDKRSTLMQRT